MYMTDITGSCLCKSVSYTAATGIAFAGHCYCEDCRRSSGTGHCTHAVVQESGFSVTGEVRFFAKPADSGNMVRRGFCPQCGSQLYSTNDATPGMIYLRASSLDNLDIVTPQLSVYASRAARWDQPPANMPALDEMPPAGPTSVMEA
jgi:hypothetical protein